MGWKEIVVEQWHILTQKCNWSCLSLTDCQSCGGYKATLDCIWGWRCWGGSKKKRCTKWIFLSLVSEPCRAQFLPLCHLWTAFLCSVNAGGELTFHSDTYLLCAPAEVLASFSTSMMPRMDRCLLLNQKKLYSSCQRLRIMVQNIKRIFSKEFFFIFFNLGRYILCEVIWRTTKIITNNDSVSQVFEFLQSYSGRVFCFGGLYLFHFSNLKLSSNKKKKNSIISCYHYIFQVHNLSTFDIQKAIRAI